jgi:hypothetical protein
VNILFEVQCFAVRKLWRFIPVLRITLWDSVVGDDSLRRFISCFENNLFEVHFLLRGSSRVSFLVLRVTS